MRREGKNVTFRDMTGTICGQAFDDENRVLLRMTIPGAPRTKKNSAVVGEKQDGSPVVLPSAAYRQYARDCLKMMPRAYKPKFTQPMNMCCLYYMPTKRRVDLVNLLEATCDIFVAAGILFDDHCGIVAAHDGSRVLYDKDKPRVEITLEAMT